MTDKIINYILDKLSDNQEHSYSQLRIDVQEQFNISAEESYEIFYSLLDKDKISSTENGKIYIY